MAELVFLATETVFSLRFFLIEFLLIRRRFFEFLMVHEKSLKENKRKNYSECFNKFYTHSSSYKNRNEKYLI